MTNNSQPDNTSDEQPKEIFFKKDLPTVLDNTQAAQPTIDGEVDAIDRALMFLLAMVNVDSLHEHPNYVKARAKITNLIAQEANKARIDERKRFDDEIDDVLTRHSKNPDLSPLAELRDYNYNAIRSLTADKEQQNKTNDGGSDE